MRPTTILPSFGIVYRVPNAQAKINTTGTLLPDAEVSGVRASLNHTK